MEKKRTARTLRLTEQDHEALLTLKEYYGLTSENEVIRMALRMALREMQRAIAASPAPNKECARFVKNGICQHR